VQAEVAGATTACKPADLLELCEAVADETVGTGMYRGAKTSITVLGRNRGSLHFWLGYKKAIMTFRVDVQSVAGASQVTSQITAFKTSQPTFLGLIPSGPKKLVGWNFYSNFMGNLADSLYEIDPKADVEIVDQPG
jgi:hypothetical protein